MQGQDASDLSQARLDEEVARKLGDFTAQGLANTLWAMAKMGRPPTAELQARYELEMTRRLGWATSTTMGRPPTAELQARLEHEVARKLGDLKAWPTRCGRCQR